MGIQRRKSCHSSIDMQIRTFVVSGQLEAGIQWLVVGY